MNIKLIFLQMVTTNRVSFHLHLLEWPTIQYHVVKSSVSIYLDSCFTFMGFCIQVWAFRDSLCLHRLFRSPSHSQLLRTSKCVAYPKKYQFHGRMLFLLPYKFIICIWSPDKSPFSRIWGMESRRKLQKMTGLRPSCAIKWDLILIFLTLDKFYPMSFMKKDSYFLYIPISVETFGYGIYW